MNVDQPEATTPVTASGTGDHPAPAAAPIPAPAPEVSRVVTGNTAVDNVLASLDTLADLPVADHVSVFERAHDQLRAALDAPAGPKPPAPGPSAG